jgi:hypothetical protein
MMSDRVASGLRGFALTPWGNLPGEVHAEDRIICNSYATSRMAEGSAFRFPVGLLSVLEPLERRPTTLPW